VTGNAALIWKPNPIAITFASNGEAGYTGRNDLRMIEGGGGG